MLFLAAVVLAWVPPWIWEPGLAAHLLSLPCAFLCCRCPRLGSPWTWGVQPRRAHALIATGVFLAAVVLAWVPPLGFGSPASPCTCSHCRALFFAAVVLAWVHLGLGESSPAHRSFPRNRCPRLGSPLDFGTLHSLPHSFPCFRCPRLGSPWIWAVQPRLNTR